MYTLRRVPVRIRLAIAFLAFIALQCANPGSPTGGPRDRKPPVVVSSTPIEGATGFVGKQVVIYFDENISLSDANTKFVISPPLEKTPKVESHANMLKVSFNDCELMPSTTYTLDFADCISDLNENNVLDGYTFTFSTGESTDSMMISGNVYDAKTLAPVKAMYVLLQANTQDSAFRTTAPIRIAKTDEYGRFAIKNIPDNKHYRVYALDDANKNFRFDQPGEAIAWMKDSVFPSMEIRQKADSVLVDSLMEDSTWVQIYKPIVKDTLVYTPDSLVLLSYTENVYDQYLLSDARKERKKIQLIFNCAMQQKPPIAFPGQDSTISHAVAQYSLTNDTVTVWLTDSLIYQKDSVVMSVRYPVLDTLNQMIFKVDTMKLWHFERTSKADTKKPKRGEKPKKEEAPMLKLTVPNNLNLYSALSITSQTPFAVFDWDAVRLSMKVDTLFEPVKFTAIDDTVNICRKALRADWKPGNDYRLEIDSASVRDVYDLQCNKGVFNFKIVSLDKYGTLYINVDSVPQNGLLQLVDKKDVVVRQVKLPPNGRAAFRYLKPSDYMLRIVVDNNQNGQWDYGSFDDKILPEDIIYYMESITVRANWDIKVDFEVGLFSIDKYARKFKITTKNKR